MTITDRTYRGVAYKASDHERASDSYVEHVYRGKRYEAPLKHAAAEPNKNVELHYRGSVYHHRKNDVKLDAKN